MLVLLFSDFPAYPFPLMGAKGSPIGFENQPMICGGINVTDYYKDCFLLTNGDWAQSSVAQLLKKPKQAFQIVILG